jgi:hypothetical protein
MSQQEITGTAFHASEPFERRDKLKDFRRKGGIAALAGVGVLILGLIVGGATHTAGMAFLGAFLAFFDWVAVAGIAFQLTSDAQHEWLTGHPDPQVRAQREWEWNVAKTAAAAAAVVGEVALHEHLKHEEQQRQVTQAERRQARQAAAAASVQQEQLALLRQIAAGQAQQYGPGDARHPGGALTRQYW